MKRLTIATLCTSTAFCGAAMIAPSADAVLPGVSFTATATDATGAPLEGAEFEVKQCSSDPPPEQGADASPWDCITYQAVSQPDGLIPNAHGSRYG